ncbi:MAG: NAD-dependent deacylase [Bacteroidia bacterium]|nr:NAD-dependent deacylase [Bacteroidia bacterium]
MKKLVVLTGAGISAESGIKTFRDSDGLWEGHDIMEVASPQGWRRNPELVMDFYNKRRVQLGTVFPNEAHLCLTALEKHFEVNIITQNVDDLHERAGSHNILHLHGDLKYMRSTKFPELRYDVGYEEVPYGKCCEKGALLRPDIVWFGEDVPNIELAAELASIADIFIIIGTSLEVYPAAGLIQYVSENCKIFIIDPGRHGEMQGKNRIEVINETAVKGLPVLAERLRKLY